MAFTLHLSGEIVKSGGGMLVQAFSPIHEERRSLNKRPVTAQFS
jgi:hypothetical protein